MKKIVYFSLFVLCSLFWCENTYAQNAITYWKNGEAIIIYEPDSVFFWNKEVNYSESNDIENIAEPTETESKIMQMTADEEVADTVAYTEQETIEYDALALEVINLFASDNDEASRRQLSRRMVKSEDDLAQEVIRTNGNNIFEDQGLVIEQQNWNSGLWGKTRYGGFETYYNTFMKNGWRYLEVVFYHKGGFPNKKTAYLKLGQVNSGKVLGKTNISPGKEYAYIIVCIDDYLEDYGCVNFFPLLITEDSKARNYLNPIFIKTEPIVANDWSTKYYGYEFGKINGVSVYFNRDTKLGNNNEGDGFYQCVELCTRYVKELNSNITKPAYGKNTWGNAIQWPSFRKDDPYWKQDNGKYIVYPNDGSTRIREGDLVVWNHGGYGHIGVIIKTAQKKTANGNIEEYVSVAHQNGGIRKAATRPIGTTMKIVDGVLKDIQPGSNNSPIFKTPQPITHLIRINNDAETVTSYSASMNASTTNMAFGNVATGKSVKKTFKVFNAGPDILTISSIALTRGTAFSVDVSNCTIEAGETRTITVTFKPTKAGEYKDRIAIQSDADDNPLWVIQLSGIGTGNDDVIPTEGLVAYYPFNGNANDESGNGNHGTVIGNVELTTDRFGNSNSAYRFFGEPFNYISVPDNETLHLSAFTLSAWVYTDSEDYGSGHLINKGRDINNGSYGLRVTNVVAQNDYYGTNGAFIEKNPSVGSWHMITGTVEGNKAKFYIDGVLMNEATLSYDFVYNNSEPLTLGMHYYGGVPSNWAYSLKGVLDDVRIYNRVLSSQEIEALYHN